MTSTIDALHVANLAALLQQLSHCGNFKTYNNITQGWMLIHVYFNLVEG